MTRRAVVLISILLLSSFAGCLSKDKDEAPQDVAPAADANGVIDGNESTAAPDGRGDLSAFKETNRTEASGMGAIEHQHDYWAGETRKHVTDLPVSLIPFPATPCKTAGTCTVGGGGETYPAGTAIADFDVAKPGLVYEGATQLELTPQYIHWGIGPSFVTGDVTQDPDHPAAKVYFDYLTAADEPGAFREGGELTVGTPFVIPVKPTEADMPHQSKSLWIFRVYSDSSTLSFTMNLSIVAVKGDVVVDWPPHPDLYAERPDRVIFEGPIHMESKGTLDSNVYGSDAGWLNPERILSWGTNSIDVEVSAVTFASQAPVPPTGWVLEYHNASKPPLMGNGQQFGARLVDDASDGATWHFSIDITNDHDSYDTPYGQMSRWGFRFVPQFDNGGQACVDGNGPLGGVGTFAQQFLVGCQLVPWSADYTMKILAHGVSSGDPLAAQAQA